MVDGECVGWGGLQPSDGEVEVAIVLKPRGWGLGPALFKRFIAQAFDELQLDSTIVLLPPSRRHVAGLRRIGFTFEGEVDCDGIRFCCYRLLRPQQ